MSIQNEFKYDSSELEALKASYDIHDQITDEVHELGKDIKPKLIEIVDDFYIWLEKREEWDTFFSDERKVAHLKKMQINYWEQFFNAEISIEYIRNRRFIGEIHAKIGLSLPPYFAALTKFLELMQIHCKEIKSVTALSKLASFDAAIIVESYNHITNQTISEQSQVIMEMSTPISAIWDGVLLLPIVGILDSKRAQDLMNGILTKINETLSKVIILDISGVAVVDTAVANHIIKITKATKLMGCTCTISGVSPAIAQTIVELGIDIDSINTTATLKDSLAFAFDIVGVTFSK